MLITYQLLLWSHKCNSIVVVVVVIDAPRASFFINFQSLWNEVPIIIAPGKEVKEAGNIIILIM